MEASRPFDEADLDVVETLETVESRIVARDAAEVDVFSLAAHFADLFAPESLRDKAGRSGAERAVRLGGEGTPELAEFAPAAFAGRAGLSTFAGQKMIADALDCRHRLPRLWARLQAGQVRVSYARLVARKTRHLSVAQAGFVDGQVAEYADGRLNWSRFETLVDATIVQADPEGARAAEEEAARRMFAKATASTDHGMRGFYLRAGFAIIARFDATVAFLAEGLARLGDPDSLDARRVRACAILANPTAAVELLATLHQLNQHIARLKDQSETETGESSRDSESSAAAADSPAPAATKPTGPSPNGEYSHGPKSECDGDADDTAPADPADAESGAGADTGRFAEPKPDIGAEQAAESEPADPEADTGPGGLDLGAADDLVPAAFRKSPEQWRLDWPRLLPNIRCYLHIHQDHLDGEAEGPVARTEHGPVTHHYVREHLAPYHRFTITPVLDPAGLAPVDAYEIPDGHRQAVHLMSPADCFPYASHTSTGPDGTDVDHTIAYQRGDPGRPRPPGQSRVGNYGLLRRFTHRVKTFAGWQVKQPFPGLYVWRDPYGGHYLVDHTGTRRIGRYAA